MAYSIFCWDESVTDLASAGRWEASFCWVADEEMEKWKRRENFKEVFFSVCKWRLTSGEGGREK